LANDGEEEKMVSKSRMSLNLRRHKKAFDVRLPAFYTSQEEFNWCPVTPTIFQTKPIVVFGGGLSAWTNGVSCQFHFGSNGVQLPEG